MFRASDKHLQEAVLKQGAESSPQEVRRGSRGVWEEQRGPGMGLGSPRDSVMDVGSTWCSNGEKSVMIGGREWR